LLRLAPHAFGLPYGDGESTFGQWMGDTGNHLANGTSLLTTAVPWGWKDLKIFPLQPFGLNGAYVCGTSLFDPMAQPGQRPSDPNEQREINLPLGGNREVSQAFGGCVLYKDTGAELRAIGFNPGEEQPPEMERQETAIQAGPMLNGGCYFPTPNPLKGIGIPQNAGQPQSPPRGLLAGLPPLPAPGGRICGTLKMQLAQEEQARRDAEERRQASEALDRQRQEALAEQRRKEEEARRQAEAAKNPPPRRQPAPQATPVGGGGMGPRPKGNQVAPDDKAIMGKDDLRGSAPIRNPGVDARDIEIGTNTAAETILDSLPWISWWKARRDLNTRKDFSGRPLSDSDIFWARVTFWSAGLGGILLFAKKANTAVGIVRKVDKAADAVDAAADAVKAGDKAADAVADAVKAGDKAADAADAASDGAKGANRKWYTAPSGKRGGKPTGKRSTNKFDADADFKRGIMRENESADRLADAGYRVEQNPLVPGSKKHPDYRIEGELFDCYAPIAAR
jgi:hypothetical protein